MAVERKGRYRAEEMNPISRVHASDDSSRSVGASGEDVARQGYETLARANPRSLWNPNRPDVGRAHQVFDGPNADDEESFIGRFVG